MWRKSYASTSFYRGHLGCIARLYSHSWRSYTIIYLERCRCLFCTCNTCVCSFAIAYSVGVLLYVYVLLSQGNVHNELYPTYLRIYRPLPLYSMILPCFVGRAGLFVILPECHLPATCSCCYCMHLRYAILHSECESFLFF